VAVNYYSSTGTVHALAEAALEDLAWADAYAFGTPTRFGAPAAHYQGRRLAELALRLRAPAPQVA
jgi:hypothetical protein